MGVEKNLENLHNSPQVAKFLSYKASTQIQNLTPNTTSKPSCFLQLWDKPPAHKWAQIMSWSPFI